MMPNQARPAATKPTAGMRNLRAAFLAVVALACVGDAWSEDSSPAPPLPRLSLNPNRGPALLRVGSQVSVRWRHRRAADSTAVLTLSQDRGRTSHVVATGSGPERHVDWTVAGDIGSGHVRLESVDGRPMSRWRRVFIRPRVRDVALGGHIIAILEDDGTVWAWGNGIPGYLPEWVWSPVRIDALTHVASIAAGGTHLIAIKEDGSAWIWGDPDSYVNPAPIIEVPRRIEGIENAVFARVGYGKAFIKVRDGRVFGLGGKGAGVLGDGVDIPPEVPTEIPALRNVTDIAIGIYHGLALRTDGTVLSWGSNTGGQLGDGTDGGRFQPAVIPDLNGIVAIAAQQENSMALRQDGTVLVWGGTEYLFESEPPYGGTPFPIAVPGLDRIKAINVGASAGYALREDGVLFAWGANNTGAVGDGTTILRNAPVRVHLPPVHEFFANGGGYAVTLDGRVFAWGASVDRPFRFSRYGTLVPVSTPRPVYWR